MEEEKSSHERVVELLNSAAFQISEKDRLETLNKVQELIVHFDSSLLEDFLDQVTGFQSDKNSAVRKFVIGFIEEVCKKNDHMLPRLFPHLELLLMDTAANVIKKVIQTTSNLYRMTLIWLSNSDSVTDDMEKAWTIITRLKSQIFDLIDHDNDGVRTQAIKFLELIILTQTYLDPDSVTRENEFNLDKMPLTVRVFRHRKLEEEARTTLGNLIRYLGTLHISSVNLMTCMSSLSIIARSRPQFMGTIIEALEILHANLPPTLTTSQVNSVRKHLKFQFLNLLKHPGAYDYHENVLNILNDLGSTQSEINKVLPKREEIRRKMKRRAKIAAESDMSLSPSKKVRVDKYTSSSQRTKNIIQDRAADSPVPEELHPKIDTPVDVTHRWLCDKLSIESVTDLVMVSMLGLPEKQPSLFSASYTPVNNSGSTAQISHLARLLASQLTAAGIGPGMEEKERREKEEKEPTVRELPEYEQDFDIPFEPPPPTAVPILPAPTVTTSKLLSQKSERILPSPISLLPPAPLKARPILQKTKLVNLNQVTKPLSWASNQKLQVSLLKRVLNCDKSRLYGGSRKIRSRVLARFATMANAQEMSELEEFIFSDFTSNSDILLSWLFANHAASQDFLDMGRMFQRANNKVSKQDISYEKLLVHIVERILSLPSNKERNDILHNILLECPGIYASTLNELLHCATQGDDAIIRIADIIKDITVYRPATPSHCLATLADLLSSCLGSLPPTVEYVSKIVEHLTNKCPGGSKKVIASVCSDATHARQEVRDVLNPLLVRFYSSDSFKSVINDMAKKHICYLEEEAPSFALQKASLGRDPTIQAWEEESIKACLYITLTILPHNHSLINILSEIYVKVFNDAKRTILRLLETPISNMGMDSPVLLSLVEVCPKGSETLITRIIHILTEKTPPSEELVRHVRDLYNKRVSDVRFLIPVLTGLEKKEVVAVLPKLIQLNPHVVKEVFNRLWGVTLDIGTSPLTPVDLMVALHLIPTDKCDVKVVIKATALCFSERRIYTPEVLAHVLQQLIEESKLPTLFMRTVIQTLAHHPQLLSFIINILQRLITKQIWNDRKAWEGFVKCCQRSMPQSFPVLLQLPTMQLAELLNTSPDTHKLILQHMNTLTTEQRDHIPAAVREIIDDPSSLGIKTEPDFEFIMDGD